jgi:phosphatidylserine/phosphatidylglycerophosphate/cardiolipin synthase-like enzyme
VSAALDALGVEALEHLADALETGRLARFDAAALREFAPVGDAPGCAQALQSQTDAGARPTHLAWTLRLLARERRARRAARDDIDLVWTGPEEGATASRDTQVVVQELFASAARSLLIASYLNTNWDSVFGALARRMDDTRALRVRMVVNIKPADDILRAPEAVAAFAQGFRRHWPGHRRPEVFYDPRTLRRDDGHVVSMHAKCVVADGERVLITSANFTEAAQVRNIEVGVTLRDAVLAQTLTRQFENLVATGLLLPLPGMG